MDHLGLRCFHFEDRAALLAEVSDRAMAQLEQAMLTRIEAVTASDPVDRARARLRETGRAYVDFALSEPGLFSVAFSAAESPEGPESPGAHRDEETPTRPYGVLNAVLDELVACGAVTSERRQGADVACWAMVHGFAELHLHGPLRDAPAQLRTPMLDAVLDVIERGLVT